MHKHTGFVQCQDFFLLFRQILKNWQKSNNIQIKTNKANDHLTIINGHWPNLVNNNFCFTLCIGIYGSFFFWLSPTKKKLTNIYCSWDLIFGHQLTSCKNWRNRKKMQSANFTCMMMMSILCHHFFSFFEEKKQIKQWLLSENNLPFYLPTYLHTQVIIIKVNNNHCKKKMFFWFWCWLIFFFFFFEKKRWWLLFLFFCVQGNNDQGSFIINIDLWPSYFSFSMQKPPEASIVVITNSQRKNQ